MLRTTKILAAVSLAFLAFAMAAHPLSAQQPEQKPVAVGQGSYADNPPLKDPKFAARYLKQPFIHPSQAGRPVPTNDWWTHLVMDGPGGRLWANPALVKFVDEGVAVSYPTSWNTGRGDKGSGVNTSSPLEIRPVGSPAPTGTGPEGALKTSVLDWGDWTVVARQERENAHWDVTFGHGLPFVWLECAGLQPSLRGKNIEVQDLNGAALSGGAADALIVKVDGQAYGVFGPVGMSITCAAGSVDIKFPDPASGWIAVGMLPDPSMAPLLKKAAGAIPRVGRQQKRWNKARLVKLFLKPVKLIRQLFAFSVSNY